MSTQQIENKQRQRLRHIRAHDGDTILAKGGATVSAFVNEDTGVVEVYGVAYCHEKDNFNRQLGRHKATGRMKSIKFSKVPPQGMHWDELVSSVEMAVKGQSIFAMNV